MAKKTNKQKQSPIVTQQPPVEAPTERLQEESQESNTTVALETETPLNEPTEASEEAIVFAELDFTPQETVVEVEEPLVIDKGGFSNPVEAVAMEIKEVRFLPVVEKLLFAGLLGGVLDKRYRPRISRIPFTVNILIPKDQAENWAMLEGIKTYDNEKQYNEAVLSSLDAIQFVEQLMEAGSKRCILTPQKAVRNSPRYMASLSSEAPFKGGAGVKVGAHKKTVYTEAELEALTTPELQTIGGWYGIKGKGKKTLIKEILNAIQTKQNGNADEETVS